jgi:hypothetical protein
VYHSLLFKNLPIYNDIKYGLELGNIALVSGVGHLLRYVVRTLPNIGDCATYSIPLEYRQRLNYPENQKLIFIS